jgi:hypothetical protein
MSFETTERIVAINPESVGTLFQQLLGLYGEDLPDADKITRTIGGHWDDSEKTIIRAASLHDGTITGHQLTDGRIAFRCLWQSDLAQAFDNGEISNAEELTDEQFIALRPIPEL